MRTTVYEDGDIAVLVEWNGRARLNWTLMALGALAGIGIALELPAIRRLLKIRPA